MGMLYLRGETGKRLLFTGDSLENVNNGSVRVEGIGGRLYDELD